MYGAMIWRQYCDTSVFLDAPYRGGVGKQLSRKGNEMITIRFDEDTSFIDKLESYEIYYRDDAEVSALFDQLDVEYEPDCEAESRIQDVYENSKTAVTVQGSAKVIDQVVHALRGGYDDFLYPWFEGDPWFLAEAVDLYDMDSSDAAFLLNKYGDAMDKGLRANFIYYLAAAWRKPQRGILGGATVRLMT